MPTDYQSSGVDIKAGYRAVELIKRHAARTARPEVLSGVGGFGGLFSLENMGIKNPVLVSGADGVGTKLRVAFELGRHDTVGIDCVAMCANDVVCSGAQPLFFLDYLAVGKLDPEQAADIVKGVAEGCALAGCALIGGETAEMPGFYAPGEYDIAGFCVGIADRPAIIDGGRIQPGDALVGLASNGAHSNGFSLIRRVFDPLGANINKYADILGRPLGEELLAPTRIYVKPVLELIRAFDIRGIAHITGGGFIENIPRMFPAGLGAVIDTKRVRVHPIFDLIQNLAGIGREAMYNTFNMGVGMVLAVPAEQAGGVCAFLNGRGEQAYVIGSAAAGTGVELC